MADLSISQIIQESLLQDTMDQRTADQSEENLNEISLSGLFKRKSKGQQLADSAKSVASKVAKGARSAANSASKTIRSAANTATNSAKSAATAVRDKISPRSPMQKFGDHLKANYGKYTAGTAAVIGAGAGVKALVSHLKGRKSAAASPKTFLSKAADKAKEYGNKAAAFGKSKTGKLVAGGSLAAIGAGIGARALVKHLRKKKKQQG